MTAAAFFDLDRTLIEGSSAFHFGRAAYKHGLLSRRQLARDAWANIRFRLRGSTDADTDALRQRILDALAGQRQDAGEHVRAHPGQVDLPLPGYRVEDSLAQLVGARVGRAVQAELDVRPRIGGKLPAGDHPRPVRGASEMAVSYTHLTLPTN